jgi:dolichyl-phosphate beta-glucosyltransferase
MSLLAPRLTFLLPVYDEAERLEASLGRLVEHAAALGEGFEVLCVDDGSRDRSRAIVSELARRDARIRSEGHATNRGKGFAIRRGLELARGERTVFLDVDLSTDLDATRPVLEALDGGSDVVLGSRHVRGARIAGRQPRFREALGRGFRRLSAAVFAPGTSDFTCGFQGFRRDAAREIASRMRIERWAFDVEIVVIARALGLAISEVPVTWHHEPGSKVRLPSAVTTSGRDLVRILARRAQGGYR